MRKDHDLARELARNYQLPAELQALVPEDWRARALRF
jgi:hypothetical protein